MKMKTVEEFIQRLQKDPDFEEQAQAYENSDEFMDFVKSSGYDFTLEQLLNKFKSEENVTNRPPEPPPVTAKTVEEFIQRLQEDPEFEHKVQSFENDVAFMEFVKNERYDFTLEQLTDGFKQGKELLKPQPDRPPTPIKVVEPPEPRMLDGSELMQQIPPVHNAEAQNRPGAHFPKFEGIVGGRRRGMKWRNDNS
jgi:predicted ribosomally synthesized peptide with nif11-like leader